MTQIKKEELEKLREEHKQKTDELYNLNLKKTRIESEVEVMKRDHQDALEGLREELTESNRNAV